MCDDAMKRERFERYRAFGLLTNTAGDDESAAWGYRPVVPGPDVLRLNEEFKSLAPNLTVHEIYEKL